MLIVVDIGNSNIEFGVFDKSTLKAKWRITTLPHTVDEFGLSVMGFLGINGLAPENLTKCAISSVVPLLTERMESMCRKFLRLEPMVVSVKNIKLPISINYKYPEEIGADRIVNAVAAYTEYKKGCIVIDFGTATTFCVITNDGKYIGGCIVPGIQISMDALFSRAAKLSRVAFEKPDKVIGGNTATSIQSGTFFGYLAMVEGIIGRIKDEVKENLLVIATGGLSEKISLECSKINHIDRDLTLKGLREIVYFNEIDNV